MEGLGGVQGTEIAVIAMGSPVGDIAIEEVRLVGFLW